MATLYVTEPGSRIKKEYRHLLVVKDDETLLRIPLADVSHVVLVGQGVGAAAVRLVGRLLLCSSGQRRVGCIPPGELA